MSNLLRIDSRDRDGSSASNTDFRVNFIPTHVKSIRVKSIVIPNVFNNIRSSPTGDANNVFSYESNSVAQNVVISDGFYSASELITLLNAGFVADGVGSTTLAINTNTGRITLTNGSGFDFEILRTNNIMADVLGITSDVTVATATTYEFPNKVNLFNYNVLYVRSNKLSNAHNLTSGTRTREPILSVVNNDVAYGANIYYTPDNHQHIVFESDTNLDNIDIQLVNHAGEVLSLPSNFHIQILIEYDKTNVY